MLQTTAIKKFLSINTYPDLANLYSAEMEVQVIVRQGIGNRIDREYKGKRWQEYSDGINSWKPIRIPYNAATEPEFEDKELTFDLCEHADGIGMTGWNFVKKQSVWVGFDFDAMVGHSIVHTKKLSDQELSDIINRVSNIPWVTVRKSTSGRGLHLYVFIDHINNSPIINNHIEHAALARSILSELSRLTNYQFEHRVDTIGGVLWQWAPRMKGTEGLKLIKQGDKLQQIPSNWRDYLNVIKGRKLRSTVPIKTEEESSFEHLCGQRPQLKLDKEHNRLIEYLQSINCYCAWDADRWMLITHTWGLLQAYTVLKLKGLYSTISPGTDLGTPNCFGFPINKGAWIIRRYGVGCPESDTWSQDPEGWTKCIFNKTPDLETSAQLRGGLITPTGAYLFDDLNQAYNVIKDIESDLKYKIECPELKDRKSKLSIKNGKLIFEIECIKTDELINKESFKLKGWNLEKKYWQRVIPLNKSNKVENLDDVNIDENIRHIVSEDRKDLGWYVKSDNDWNYEPYVHVKNVLEGPMGLDNKVVRYLLGSNVIKAWTVTNIPFQPEYPGGRIWNLYGAQLKYPPTLDDNLSYPTWQAILNHCGASLDDSVKDSKWGKDNSISTGADYLLCWIACAIQNPYQHLPYLFFYGPENSGKSSFHQALSLLVTKGYVRADNALINSSAFNAELESALFCVIEELNLKEDKSAYMRIKDWTVADQIALHKKHQNQVMIRNTTHWIQCANTPEYCPIFQGDTRITVVYVDHLQKEIPWLDFKELLIKEAPDFIAKIKSLELPKPIGRYSIPIIITSDKSNLQINNRNEVEEFLETECFYSPGKTILYQELYNRFKMSMHPQDALNWTIQRFGKMIPPKFPKGRSHSDQAKFHIGNISFTTPNEEDLKRRKLISKDNWIELENNEVSNA